MKRFIDQHGCNVTLTFSDRLTDEDKVTNVFVVCRYGDKWVLTEHKKRGLEFPGGKVEAGESLVAAAKREVYEETGATVNFLEYIGQYEVKCEHTHFFKNIYFATVTHFDTCAHYYETNGPVLLKEFPPRVEKDPRFSFIMKDELLPNVLQELKRRGFA